MPAGPAEFEMSFWLWPSGPFGWEACEWIPDVTGDESVTLIDPEEPFVWLDDLTRDIKGTLIAMVEYDSPIPVTPSA